MHCCIGWGNRTWCPGHTIRKRTRPRKRHSKNQLPERLSAIQAEHPDKHIELWFQDEARFGQQGCNSRIWADTGSRPVAPRQTEYEYLYLFGAVCPETGASNGWLMPFANTQTMQGQLDDLGRHLAAEVHAALLLDGAGWHHSLALNIPDNLTLVHLPAYSPELNAAEMLWREMRQTYLSNRVYPDAAALDHAIATAWLALSNAPERLQRLTDFPWIRAARAKAFQRPDTS